MYELPLFGERAAVGPAMLADYDKILVNSSAGKDSQCMLDVVVQRADREGVRERIVVLHCDLGLSPKGNPIEWAGTKELAQKQAQHYGLRFVVARRGVRGFLEEIEDRGYFPSAPQRYCTSYFKREEGQKVLTALGKEVRNFLQEVERRGRWPANRQRYCTDRFKTQPGQSALVQLANEVREYSPRAPGPPRLLNCFGFRAEESPRRKKLPAFAPNKKANNSRKKVDDWLPIHHWSTQDVWARIKASGVPHHPAYDLGMPRLSCVFCIFAPPRGAHHRGPAQPGPAPGVRGPGAQDRAQVPGGPEPGGSSRGHSQRRGGDL